jgi:exoribonuclease R
VLDLAESVTLAAHVGETFDASIVEVQSNDPRKGLVMLRDPAIEAAVSGTTSLPLGASVKVQLVEANPAKRTTQFAWAG